MQESPKNHRGDELITHDELQAFAARIISLERSINSQFCLHHATLLGHGLCIVRECLPKREFSRWLSDSCGIGQRRASRYMRLSHSFPEYLNPDTCPGNLAIDAALELISVTDDDILEMVKQAIAAGKIINLQTVRELSENPDIRPIQTQKVQRFELTKHCCIHCMGRLLVRRIGKAVEYLCAECEHRSRGDVAPCWCNKTIGDPRVGGYDKTKMLLHHSRWIVFLNVPLIQTERLFRMQSLSVSGNYDRSYLF